MNEMITTIDDNDSRERGAKREKKGHRLGRSNGFKKGISGPGRAEDTCDRPRGTATGVCACGLVIGQRKNRKSVGEDVKL